MSGASHNEDGLHPKQTCVHCLTRALEKIAAMASDHNHCEGADGPIAYMDDCPICVAEAALGKKEPKQ